MTEGQAFTQSQSGLAPLRVPPSFPSIYPNDLCFSSIGNMFFEGILSPYTVTYVPGLFVTHVPGPNRG